MYQVLSINLSKNLLLTRLEILHGNLYYESSKSFQTFHICHHKRFSVNFCIVSIVLSKSLYVRAHKCLTIFSMYDFILVKRGDYLGTCPSTCTVYTLIQWRPYKFTSLLLLDLHVTESSFVRS